MTTINIPVRYYKDFPGGYDHAYETLPLPLAECALLLVDVDGTTPNPTTENLIAPALDAARSKINEGLPYTLLVGKGLFDEGH